MTAHTRRTWEISGTTRIYAHLAHPSGHVRAPQLLNRAFADRGVDAAAVSIDVAPGDLAAMVTALRAWQNLAGAGVTMPHKETILGLLDSVTRQARQIGAVNLIRRDPDGSLHGNNIDGIGFVAGLRRAGHEPKGRRAVLVGAGGAARAIAFALLEVGVSELRIVNRDPARATALTNDLVRVHGGLVHQGRGDPRGYDLVVNATSLGMLPGQPLPLDPAGLDDGTVVADVVMSPPVTPLLAAAAARGLPCVPGLPMLECQIDVIQSELGLDPRAGAAATNPMVEDRK